LSALSLTGVSRKAVPLSVGFIVVDMLSCTSSGWVQAGAGLTGGPLAVLFRRSLLPASPGLGEVPAVCVLL
jgi:hypothetical protein